MDAGKRQDALARALAGDSQARGELLESFRPYLQVIARSFHDARLQARFDESDVVQDTLLAAHRAFESLRGRTVAELVAWLREIVIRSDVPVGVALRLKTHVYGRIDPRNRETSYVGKGQGTRIFSHIQAEQHLEGDELDITIRRS